MVDFGVADQLLVLTPAHWRTLLTERIGKHLDVELTGIRVDAPLLATLGPSVATFQLGESGTGEHLLAAATRARADAEYIEALRLFVNEEQEHARLLALLLREMHVAPRTRHWSDTIFVQVRRLHSLRTEVLVLLVAEVIALTYYSALRDGVGDPVLAELFGRIHNDEIIHVRFHTDTLPKYLDQFPEAVRATVRLAWSAVVTAATIVVALDHGRVLRSVGITRREFLKRTQQDRKQIAERLFGSAARLRRHIATVAPEGH